MTLIQAQQRLIERINNCHPGHQARVRMCGNSVAPPVAAALVRANYVERSTGRKVA